METMKKESVRQINDPICASPPDHVQIQTITGCNANCIFCPNGKSQNRVPMGRPMDWDLFRSVVDQCIELGVRRYSLYLMNEPMLDRELPERIVYISARIKKPQYVKFSSHGGLLTERMAKGLLDSGLKKLKISVQSLDREIYWKIMRLPLGKTLRNIDRFLELKEKGGYKTPRLEIVMVDSIHNHDEIPGAQQYWGKRNIKFYIEPVENRADQENIRGTAIGAELLQAFSWCRRLTEMIYVLYDGRMIQCCADWEQRGIMGDLTKDGLRDIWFGTHYSDFRSRFAKGDVKGMICECCRKQPKKI
jgi:molybdenum cofactor biosynthesis enzyme MoaA